jgi:hypothetical protein
MPKVILRVDVPTTPFAVEKNPGPESLSDKVVDPVLTAALPNWSSNWNVKEVLVVEETAGVVVLGVMATWLGAPA